MRLQKEMMEMLGSLSGRVTQLEGKPHTAPTEATAGSKSGTTGLNELEQRLAGVRTVMAGDAAQFTRTPATSGVESRGPGKTSPSEDAKTNDKAKDKHNAKDKTKDEYDVTAVMSRGEPSPDADATVRKRMEMRAQFNKYLGKQALQKEGWS